jgi:hypothetical protein
MFSIFCIRFKSLSFPCWYCHASSIYDVALVLYEKLVIFFKFCSFVVSIVVIDLYPFLLPSRLYYFSYFNFLIDSSLYTFIIFARGVILGGTYFSLLHEQLSQNSPVIYSTSLVFSSNFSLSIKPSPYALPILSIVK